MKKIYIFRKQIFKFHKKLMRSKKRMKFNKKIMNPMNINKITCIKEYWKENVNCLEGQKKIMMDIHLILQSISSKKTTLNLYYQNKILKQI